MTRQLIESELQREGLRLRSAIEVEGREAVFETVAGGLGIGIVSTAEFGNSRNLHALPILDCRERMTETIVCLREQSSRRIIETFLELVRSRPDAPTDVGKNNAVSLGEGYFNPE